MMSDDNKEHNPYDGRNHEGNGIQSREDVLAVAGLLGQVTGSLVEIDKQQVGSDSHFIRAKKMDAKQALNNIVGNSSVQTAPAVQAPALHPVPKPTVPRTQAKPVQAPQEVPTVNESDLVKRVTELEKIVEAYKKVIKFKRGVSYTVSTTNIKGEFKSPEDILDLISSEMSKQTKSITLKLNDTNKTKR